MSLEKRRVCYSLVTVEFQFGQKILFLQVGRLFFNLSVLDLIKLYDKI